MIPGLGRTEVVMKFAQISGSYTSKHIYMVVIIYPYYIITNDMILFKAKAKDSNDSNLNIPFLANVKASPTVGGVIPS